MFTESIYKCGSCTRLWEWWFSLLQSSQGVTDSVIAFINNLDKVPLEPLTTGAISVPYDALNPKIYRNMVIYELLSQIQLTRT